MSTANAIDPSHIARREELKDMLLSFQEEKKDIDAELRDLRFRYYTKRERSKALKSALDAKTLENDDLVAKIQACHAELGSIPRVRTLPHCFMRCAETVLPKEKFDEILTMAVERCRGERA